VEQALHNREYDGGRRRISTGQPAAPSGHSPAPLCPPTRARFWSMADSGIDGVATTANKANTGKSRKTTGCYDNR
jgi:hypothetical protein